MTFAETQWTTQLQSYLKQLDSTTGIHPESDRISDISKSGSVVIGDRIVRRDDVVAAPARSKFSDGVIEQDALKSIDPVVFRATQLEIKAKPEWVIASRQAYYQTKPVPLSEDPIQVGQFSLWADPEPDYVDLEISDEVYDRLKRKGTTQTPPIINPRPLPSDRVVSRLPDRVVVAGTDRINTIPISDRRVMLPPLSRFQILAPALENIRSARIPTRRAFFACTTPWCEDVQFTVHQAYENGTLQITGGTAILTVSFYTQESREILEKYRSIWTDALTQARYGTRLWKFLPVSLRNIQAVLNLDPPLLQSPVKAVVNSITGTATFVIELSALGTQVWKNLLEQRRASEIPGMGLFTVKYYAQSNERINIQQRLVAMSLGSLLTDVGPEIIQTINSAVSVEPKIVVQGNPIIDSVVVKWTTNTGSTALSKRFDTNGGLLSDTIETQDISHLEVNWNATVTFKTASWSTVPQVGKLTLSTSLVDIVKPSSWIRDYTLMTLMMASPTQISTDPTEFEDIGVEATLTFNAAYLQAPLTTTFNPAQTITTVPFPLVPGQVPTQVALIITTTLKSENRILNSVTRSLQPDETLISANIFRDGHVEIFTPSDPLPEISLASEILDLLTQMEKQNS